MSTNPQAAAPIELHVSTKHIAAGLKAAATQLRNFAIRQSASKNKPTK